MVLFVQNITGYGRLCARKGLENIEVCIFGRISSDGILENLSRWDLFFTEFVHLADKENSTEIYNIRNITKFDDYI